MFRRLSLVAMLLLSSWSFAVAQSAKVEADIKKVDDWATDSFKQYEREDAMERLAASGEDAAISKLIELLNDDFANIRTAGERVLVEAKGDADKLLIDEGLGSKKDQVRIRAARVLGLRKATAAVDALAKQARGDKLVAARVTAAQALGRIGGDEAAEALRKILKAGDAASGAAARSLGKDADDDTAKSIAKLLKEKDWAAAVGAADGLAACGADKFTKELSTAIPHKDWRVRIAVAQALATVETVAEPELFSDAYGELLEDKDWRVRRRTIEALVDLWQPLGAELLVARLADEETALRYDIVHAMEDLTGQRFGYLPEAWQNWWKGQGRSKGLVARKPRPEYGWLRGPRGGETGEEGEGKTASYFDIPVLAQPTAFAFDMSGSMRDAVSKSDGRLRIDVARGELAETLDNLPEGAPFNLVIYRYYSGFPVKTEVQRAFPKGVQDNNPKTIQQAKDWIGGMEALGWGAFYEGISAALEDTQVQAVYFLSDGAPSRGDFVQREALIDALNELRRFHPATIHTVLVGGGYRDEEFMSGMAKSCGGTFADARGK
ncbi:MAG: HEAT repeat domain-containing protein [Planctomycetes bacterium]|nr:HEAT repeat domain-containing protein [Planctomycetota bacterium]